MNTPLTQCGPIDATDSAVVESEITDVSAFLKEALTEEFDYVPNPGNAGDALMAKATYDLFDKLNLRYRSLEHSSLDNPNRVKNQVIVLGGGGNFTEGGYNSYAKLLARIHQHAKLVIVLPHTIHGNAELLSELGNNVVLFCRERVSHEHVRRHAKKARVLLAHDMAFLLDVQSVLSFKTRYLSGPLKKALYKASGSDRYRLFPGLVDYWQGFRSRVPILCPELPRGRIGNLYRTDIEKTGIALPKGNIDASLAFNFGVTSPVKAGFTVFHLFRFLGRFDVVHTNRLHLAIAAALLGKKVNFSSNSYFKCRAVYEHSLRKQYPNVNWIDA